MELNKKKLLIDEKLQINQAIKLLENSKNNILFLLKGKKLSGVFQDNDLRRAIINKKSLKDRIISISQKKPKFIYEAELSEKNVYKIFNKYNCEAIPVIKKDKTIVDIIFLKKTIFTEKLSDFPKVLVMAGGRGNRLRPITNTIPKPLAKFKNKPILDYILSQFNLLKAKEIFISVNYKKEKIISFIKNKNYNFKTFFLKEQKKLGTAGPLSLIKNYLKKDENIIVINGDLIFNFKIKNILDFHSKNNLDITVVTKDIDYQIPYGLVKTKKNLLDTLDEKPKIMARVIVGIYIINSSCLKSIKKDYLDMPDFIKFLIKKKKRVGYYPIFEKFNHITKKSDLK